MSEPGELCCFLIEHKGVYLGGFSIVWAANEERAREDAIRLLRESTLPEYIWTITEIPVGEDRVIWNGDY